MRATRCRDAPSGSGAALVIGVSIPPGAMAFTRRPRSMYSTARHFVRLMTPPFEAPYAAL